MAKGSYIGINNVARQIKRSYIGINNVAREIRGGYVGIDNVAREIFIGLQPAGDLPVGSSVYMKINGISKEFIIVQQGLPSSSYDSSCDGTWLMMAEDYTKMKWATSLTTYGNSSVHNYLQNDFFNLIDSDIRDIIKQVKIPSCTNLTSGAVGSLTAKVFLLSVREMVSNELEDVSISPAEGSTLDFFKNLNEIYNPSKNQWWTRSPFAPDNTYNWVWFITTQNNTNNVYGTAEFTYSYGIKPALVLPSDVLVDYNFNIITEV